MDERVIIKSRLINIKAISVAIFMLFSIVPILVGFIDRYKDVASDMEEWDMNWGWVIESYGENPTPFRVTISRIGFLSPCLIILGAAVLALLFYIIFHKTILTVTDKRVFGVTSWGKRVDLPFDSISAVGTGALRSIAVATSSGKIKFALIKNRDEIHDVISGLLIERQNSSNKEVPKAGYQPAPISFANIPAVSFSETEEIKKYKELLDSGIITQEEFDAKKKQLLGL